MRALRPSVLVLVVTASLHSLCHAATPLAIHGSCPTAVGAAPGTTAFQVGVPLFLPPLSATGGVPPYNFSATGLPAGVSAVSSNTELTLTSTPTGAAGTNMTLFMYKSTYLNASHQFQSATSWDVVTMPSDLNPAGQNVSVTLTFSGASPADLFLPQGEYLLALVNFSSIGTGLSLQFEDDRNNNVPWSAPSFYLWTQTRNLLALPGDALQSTFEAVAVGEVINNAVYTLSFTYLAYASIYFTVVDSVGSTATYSACPVIVTAGASLHAGKK